MVQDTPGDRALADLHRVLRGALDSSGMLLTAGERVLVERMLVLHGPAGRLWIRLLARKGSVQRVDSLTFEDVPDPDEALSRLQGLDLVHRSLPWALRRETLRVAELKDHCRDRGLRVGGRRQDLLGRLEEDPGGVPCVRVVGRGLVRRMERLWFRSVWRDRSSLLLERMGQVQYVDHPLTRAEPAFPNRREMRAFERALTEPCSLDDALTEVERRAPRGPAFRRLDLRRVRVDQSREALRELERAGELEAAAQGYERLLEAGLRNPGPVAQRLALCLGRLDRAEEGMRVCARHLSGSAPGSRPALERTGRRLAKAAGLSWRAGEVLRKPPERRLYLAQQGGRRRPLWGPEEELVEAAVLTALRPRHGLFAENLLWTTLFGALLGDLYFLPVPGTLPTPCMDGPLDLGTPAFLEARRAPLEERLAWIEEDGAAVLDQNWTALAGRLLRGVSWEAFPREDLRAIAGHAGVSAVLRRMLEEGWRAASGLPDLCVLPGSEVQVEDCIPSRVAEGLVLIEVKGRGDQLRDEQRVWHHRLLEAGFDVEVWRVEPSGGL